MAYREKTAEDPAGAKRKVLAALGRGWIMEEHVKMRMVERLISDDDIRNAIRLGKIVSEEIHQDPPCLRYRIEGPAKPGVVVLVSFTSRGRLNIITAWRR